MIECPEYNGNLCNYDFIKWLKAVEYKEFSDERKVKLTM